jgi:predicted O-methyltransferase YrrM
MKELPTYLESVLQAIFADHNLINIQQHEWEMRTFLKLALDELKPARTVELGTYKGFTSALLSLITSIHTVSVDVEDHGSEVSRCYGHHLTTILDNAAEDGCVNRVMTMLNARIDLLFIDDGHYYETIVREFELWRRHVRPGGWIVFHDINPLANIGPHGTQPDCIQVPRFWKELSWHPGYGPQQEIIATEEHKAFKGTLPHGGIGILRV